MLQPSCERIVKEIKLIQIPEADVWLSKEK
jgi:hypothetical protein